MRAIRVVVLAAVVFGLGAQGGRGEGPAGGNPDAERDDLEDALAGLGFEVVRVFPFTGLPSGTIRLVEGEAVKPIDVKAAVLAEAKKLPREGETLAPETLSGQIVLAVKAAPGAGAVGRPCVVSVVVRRTIPADLGMGKTGVLNQRKAFRIIGTVPEEAADGQKDRVVGVAGGRAFVASEAFTAKGGKKFEFYNLQLAPEDRKEKQPPK